MSVNDLAQTDDVLAYAAALLSPPTFAESSKSPAVPPLAVGVGLDMGGGEIVELARPERRRARVSRAHAASIAARRNLWPREFRQCRSHAITLRFTERTDRPPVRVEIRWREGRGFAAMAVGLGGSGARRKSEPRPRLGDKAARS